jgi:hypothetical protein
MDAIKSNLLFSGPDGPPARHCSDVLLYSESRTEKEAE